MQRMWRQMFAALAGVLVVAGLASAQAPIPQQLPQSPIRGQYVAIPGAPVAAPVAPTVAPAGGQVFVRGSGGCNSCGSASTAVPCKTGNTCNNGCGSFKSDCAFMFGSCKKFFDPCGPVGNGCGNGHGRGHGPRCGVHPFGKPYSNGYNGCNYDSYLNH